MIYLGDFNFDAVETNGPSPGDYHGHFSMLVEADDIETAMSKLRATIRRQRRSKNGPLGAATDVYMQSLIEVVQMPEAGFIGYLEYSRGEFPGGINIAAPGTSEKFVLAYTDGDEETNIHEPFVSFKPKAAQKPVRPKSPTTKKT